MDTQHSTSTDPENQDPFVNSSLNLSRWKYFKSLAGQVLAAQFDSDDLLANPWFIEIDEFEYRHLLKEMNHA